SVSSLRAVVDHFCPSITAQSGGCVVAPSFISSTFENLNISITYTGKEQGSFKEALNPDSENNNNEVLQTQSESFLQPITFSHVGIQHIARRS
ncbi:hypothetical protein INR49_005721, partial [Caranx melampygus]